MHNKFLDLDSLSSDKMERHKYAKLIYWIAYLKIDAFGTVNEYKQDQMIIFDNKTNWSISIFKTNWAFSCKN